MSAASTFPAVGQAWLADFGVDRPWGVSRAFVTHIEDFTNGRVVTSIVVGDQFARMNRTFTQVR